MKRFVRRLTIGFAVVIGIVAFAPVDADARHRRPRRHVVHLHSHVLHGHHLHGHGRVSFAYYDAENRPVYRDRRGLFYFGPRGGHIHFDG